MRPSLLAFLFLLALAGGSGVGRPAALADTAATAARLDDISAARRHHHRHYYGHRQSERRRQQSGVSAFFARTRSMFGQSTQSSLGQRSRASFRQSPRLAAAQGSCSGRSVVATWYSSGRRTASGQAFNPHGYTAAHRSLPFGSRVTVRNPRTGQSVTVVINDRGPFTRGVTLDLSLGAAHAIGMHSTQAVCMS